ncbi:hypothetical protein [Rhodoblastus sp.]|uniref:hypothetical protein n=1 Tax=Rhodoblastus sp. TaxID=1962975 RepID=UPI003F986C4E
MNIFTKYKNQHEVWQAETFSAKDGATVFDLRLKRKNGVGELVPTKSASGTLIALIANVEQIPILIALLDEIYRAAKGAI